MTNQPEAVGASPALDCLSGGGEMGFIEQIVELTPVVITVFDVVAERDIYVSRDVATLIGLTRDDVLQMKDPVSTVWHPDDVPRYSGLLARWKRLADGEISEFRFRARRGEGEWRWLETRVMAFLRSEQGEVRQVVAATLDVTSRQQAEEALRASDERFRRSFELGLIGMAITSPEKGCIEVNDEICKMLGYERRELLRMTWAEMTHPDDLAADVANFERVKKGECEGYSLDKRWIRKDGQVIDSTISVKCVRREDGAVDYFVALLQDITARKRAEDGLARSHVELEQRVAQRTSQLSALNGELLKEIAERTRTQEELRRSEAYVAEAQRISHVGSWALNFSAGEIFWSLENYRIFGVNPEAFGLTISRILRFIHSEDRRFVQRRFAKAVSRKGNLEADFRIVLRDGSIRRVQCIGHPMMNESGDLVEFVGALMDVTERHQAEKESLALRNQLATELAAMTRLHDFSTRLLKSTELKPLLEEVLNAIMDLQEADFGLVQLYNPETQALEIVTQSGFQQDFLDHFASVHDGGSTCGRALQQRERVILEDVETDPGFAPYRHIAASNGFRAVQSTPLFSRSGEPLGMVSTHFRQPHRPSEHQLRFTDLYAAQAAEMIEHKQSEEAVLRYQQELQTLTARLIEAQEMESKYLARELHDDFSQKLAVLGMEIAALADLESSQKLGGRMLQFTAQIGALAKDIHRISRQLHPAILDDLGLAAALKNECIAFSEQHGVPFEFDPYDIPRELPEDISLCLYRVAQESLRNVGKHAAATEVFVALTAGSGEIALEIHDVGQGFEVERLKGKGGLGLVSMEERVRLVNGTFSILSQPGHGTTVKVRVPLRPSGS